MTVYVLIPVFNQLAHTKAVLDCLRRQTDVDLRLVIVDDGSSDGTAEYLAQQPDLMVLKGDGQLWWAGAIDLALRSTHPLMQRGDFFLFMNNDTKVGDDFAATLVRTSLDHGRAVVGSIVLAAEPPHRLLDVGPRADLWNRAIWDIARDLSEDERIHLKAVYPVDFLPGRGTLYPGEVLDRIAYMRPLLLPHYHADYEFADRARRAGYPLLVASAAVTYSTAEFGNQRKIPNFWQRKFGKGSPENVVHKVAFFCLVGSPAQRLSAVPRMLLAEIRRALHRWLLPWLRPVVHSLLWRLLGIALKLMSFLPAGIYDRMADQLWRLVQPRVSMSAGARVRLMLERRGRQRLEALHVYAAALVSSVGAGRLLATGSAIARHLPFFESLAVAAQPTPESGQADLVFYSCDSEQRGRPLAIDAFEMRPQVGGVLYVVCYGAVGRTQECLQTLADRLASDPGFKVLANTNLDGSARISGTWFLPPKVFSGARPVSGGEPLSRVFAARRLH